MNVLIIVLVYFMLSFFSVVSSQADTIATRAQKIQDCRKCHPTEYENWKKGPHANAHGRLLQYKELVLANKGDYDPSIVKSVEDLRASLCFNCHAPKNIFETILPSKPNADFNKKLYGLSNYIPAKLNEVSPQAREEEMELGIDCLSCHVKDNQVFTKPSYKLNKELLSEKEFCRPQPSQMFTKGLMCFSCHSEDVSHFAHKRQITKNKNPKYQNCGQCHSPKGDNGTWNHYYGWRKDIEEGNIPPLLKELFDGVDIKLITNDNKNYFNLKWNNESMPHDFTLVTEITLSAKIQSLDGMITKIGEYRFNRKNDFNKIMGSSLDGQESNFDFHFRDEGLNVTEPLTEQLSNTKNIILEFKKKAQFYSPDHYFPIAYKRIIPVQ